MNRENDLELSLYVRVKSLCAATMASIYLRELRLLKIEIMQTGEIYMCQSKVLMRIGPLRH